MELERLLLRPKEFFQQHDIEIWMKKAVSHSTAAVFKFQGIKLNVVNNKLLYYMMCGVNVVFFCFCFCCFFFSIAFFCDR